MQRPERENEGEGKMEREANYPGGGSRMKTPERNGGSKNLLKTLILKVRGLRERSRNLRELRGINDHQLSDLGLSRVDVERIASNSLFRDSTLRDRW